MDNHTENLCKLISIYQSRGNIDDVTLYEFYDDSFFKSFITWNEARAKFVEILNDPIVQREIKKSVPNVDLIKNKIMTFL